MEQWIVRFVNQILDYSQCYQNKNLALFQRQRPKRNKCELRIWWTECFKWLKTTDAITDCVFSHIKLHWKSYVKRIKTIETIRFISMGFLFCIFFNLLSSSLIYNIIYLAIEYRHWPVQTERLHLLVVVIVVATVFWLLFFFRYNT